MWKNESSKDKIVIIAALFAVAGMIAFLIYVQHIQRKEQQRLAESGEEMAEESNNALEMERTKAAIGFKSIDANSISLYNGGTEDFSLEGFEIRFDGEIVYQFQDEEIIRSGEELLCRLNAIDDFTDETVVELYSGENELQQQTVYSLLSAMSRDFYFTIPSGFYSEGVTVEIVAPEGSTVYYTLDGSEPTQESEIYKEALKIDIQNKEAPYYAAKNGISITSRYIPSVVDKAFILRAVYVDGNGRQSDSIMAEYFIAFEVKAAYSGIPVLSLLADEEGLFDYYSGIYVSGREYEDAIAQGSRDQKRANYYMGWSIPAYAQYYEANRGITYSASVMLSVVDNNYTDGGQKSLRIAGNESTVSRQSSLCYFMGEEGRGLILENGQADGGLKLRSMLGAALLSETEIVVPKIQPCIVFLNGEYWGMYLMTLPLDEYHIAEANGLEEDEVVVCRSGASEEDNEGKKLYEDMVEYIVGNDMKVDENYIQVEQMLDIQNYLEYVCSNIYIGNSDWPNENACAWRSLEAGEAGVRDGRWRFIWNDAEQSMGNSALSSPSLNTYLRPMIAEDQMLYSLLRNDEFRRRYLATMQDMIDVFEEKRVNETIDEITGLCGRAVMESYERFQGSLTPAAYNAGVEVCRSFFAERSEYILNYTDEFLEMERVFLPEEEEMHDVSD